MLKRLVTEELLNTVRESKLDGLAMVRPSKFEFSYMKTWYFLYFNYARHD